MSANTSLFFDTQALAGPVVHLSLVEVERIRFFSHKCGVRDGRAQTLCFKAD